MEKREFLEKLARALAGQVPQTIIEENLRYYENYLSEEAAKGKRMHQILEELGDPRLLAKSIIDANGGGNDRAGIYADSSPSFDGSERYQEEADSGRGRFYNLHLRGFWAILMMIVVLGVLLMLIGAVIGGIFLLLRFLLIPLLLVGLVYGVFRWFHFRD